MSESLNDIQNSGKRVAGYVRVSDLSQVDGGALVLP
jgi:hypothetical protein